LRVWAKLNCDIQNVNNHHLNQEMFRKKGRFEKFNHFS